MIRVAILIGVFFVLVVLLVLAARIRIRFLRYCLLAVIGICFALYWAEVVTSTGILEGFLGPTRDSEGLACAWTYELAGTGRLAKVKIPRGILAMDGRWPGHHPELFRLMFVGDSFTAGQGVHTGKEFAVQVADALRDKAPSRELQLLNHAKPGMDFITEYTMFRDYSANYAPDVVVWVFVLNDLTHDFNVGLAGFDDYIIDRTRSGFKPSWSRAWDFVRLCLRRYRAGRIMEQAYRDIFNPEKNGEELQLFENRLAEMVREIRSRGARFVFVVFPLLIDFEDYPFRQAHKTLVQLASRAGAETLDLLPYFEKINEHKLWASSDDHHPNAYGHRIAAEAITYHLTEGELPAAGPRSCQVRRQGDATRVQELLQAGLREEAYNLARELACTFPDSPEVALVMAKCYLAVSEARRKHYTYWTLAAVHLLQARVLAAGLAQGEREEIESRVDKLLSEMVAIVGL